MEGMEKVHDGSSDDLEYGDWLSNIIAINSDGNTIIPVYSELYTLKHASENGHLVVGWTTVSPNFGVDRFEIPV
jgi:hypothetical protein